MFEEGAALNAGRSHHDYTFSGNQYTISIVDAEGIPIASYALDGRVEVCILVPDELRPNLSSIVVVARNTDGTLTATSFRWQITRSSYYSCGYTSTLPATVAVGIPGAPPEMLPATGGAAPTSRGIIAWALLVGVALIATGTFATVYRRRRHEGTR